MAYEDFTTFTEVDEGSDITINSSTNISWAELKTRRETGYVYKDKGIDHFNGDFTHEFECEFMRADIYNLVAWWLVSDGLGDRYDLVLANKNFASFEMYGDNEEFRLKVCEGGAFSGDTWAAPGPQLDTWYFITIVRDDDGGANSTGRYTAYITG